MIKAIYFDWGHTFATFFENREQKLDQILKPFGFNWRTFNHFWRGFYILRSSGKIESDKELEIFIRRVAQKDIPVQKIIETTIKNHFISTKHIEIVKKLKKKYKVGILSNNVQEWVDKVIKNCKIEKLFDAVIVSSKVKARKPNAKIYYEAIKKLSVKPEETIFVADEIAEDLVAASGLGIKTIWFNMSQKGSWEEDDRNILKIYKPNASIKNLKEVINVVKAMNK